MVRERESERSERRENKGDVCLSERDNLKQRKNACMRVREAETRMKI